MDTLFLTNLNLKFKPVVKDRLFYDRYEYCLKFNLDEVSSLKELNHRYIDTVISRRRQWREISLQRLINSSWNNHKTILARSTREITDETVANLHTLTDQLLNSTVEYKLVTSVNQGWIYSNDLALIDALSQLEFLRTKEYTQAIIDRPKNTIKLQNPEHRYRSFFKSVKLSAEEKQQLINFISNQTDIRVSPALAHWMEDQWHRTQDYFFIDHDTESWLILLSLVRPGMIRKTSELIAG